MAALMAQCDSVTRFLLLCTDDLASAEGGGAGQAEGSRGEATLGTLWCRVWRAQGSF